jgi:hypothetical protein
MPFSIITVAELFSIPFPLPHLSNTPQSLFWPLLILNPCIINTIGEKRNQCYFVSREKILLLKIKQRHAFVADLYYF